MTTFRINGRAVKRPSTFKREYYNVTDMQRLANAQMVGDLIAQKVKFYLTYEAITQAELDNILDAIWSSKKLFYAFEVYEDSRLLGSWQVYSGSIPQELHHAGRNFNWVWKNVSFNLIER